LSRASARRPAATTAMAASARGATDPATAPTASLAAGSTLGSPAVAPGVGGDAPASFTRSAAARVQERDDDGKHQAKLPHGRRVRPFRAGCQTEERGRPSDILPEGNRTDGALAPRGSRSPFFSGRPRRDAELFDTGFGFIHRRPTEVGKVDALPRVGGLHPATPGGRREGAPYGMDAFLAHLALVARFRISRSRGRTEASDPCSHRCALRRKAS
jgi:hypothetical protein